MTTLLKPVDLMNLSNEAASAGLFGVRFLKMNLARKTRRNGEDGPNRCNDGRLQIVAESVNPAG